MTNDTMTLIFQENGMLCDSGLQCPKASDEAWNKAKFEAERQGSPVEIWYASDLAAWHAGDETRECWRVARP